MSSNLAIQANFGKSPFSWRFKLARQLWLIVQATLYRLSPRPFHAWRRALLRLFGAKIGQGCHPYPRAVFWAPWNIVIGENVGIDDDVFLYSQGKIVIGDNSIISTRAFLCTGSHDYTVASHKHYCSSIVIGSNVWVAASAFIHPGVCLLDGCVVGACSVVTRDMPAWTVCAGNPCRPLKSREWNSKL